MQISNVPLIDTHTHLFSLDFQNDRAEAIQRAVNAGVSTMLLPNIDVDSIEALNQMLIDFPAHCKGMMGLHPCSIGHGYQGAVKIIENQIAEFDGYIGIGEIGLDYYWGTKWMKEQKYAFCMQLDWAKELGLPVSIHSRAAFDDTLDLVSQAQDGRLTGVFHCFGGDEDEAKQITDAGFLLGIGGVCTYRNSIHPRVLPQVDLSWILLETDSPYLSPKSKRRARNESANLTLIAQELAAIYKTDYSAIASATTRNAKKLFRL